MPLHQFRKLTKFYKLTRNFFPEMGFYPGNDS